jgi:hypothetical protein
VLPRDVQLLELSSHVHQRGRRFRIFEGKFACQSGAGDGLYDACRAEFGVTTDDEMFVLIGSYVER